MTKTFKDIKCPTCLAKGAELAFSYKDFPSFLFPMPREKALVVEKKDIDLYICRSCGHIFQTKVNKNLISKIYSEYYENYPFDFAEQMKRPYRDPFDMLFKLIATTQPQIYRGNLLEIGSSKQANMLPFAELGFSCYGVDPSPLAKDEQVNPNIELISGYYESVKFSKIMDLIVSRFSLEHVVNISEHVNKMNEDMKTGGLVIVQVPNIEYYFNNGLPLFAAHEHINYFSIKSLCALFKRFGFSLVTCYQNGQPSIIVVFKKESDGATLISKNLFNHVRPFQSSIEAKLKIIKNLIRSQEKIVLYGSGLNLFWILNQVDELDHEKVTLVDDNPNLWGKYIPAYSIAVQEPKIGHFENSGVVILTLNPIYHDKVMRRLKLLGIPLRVASIAVETINETLLS